MQPAAYITTNSAMVITNKRLLPLILAVALGGNSLGGGKFNLAGSIIGAYTIQAITTTIHDSAVAEQQSDCPPRRPEDQSRHHGLDIQVISQAGMLRSPSSRSARS